MWKPLPIKNLEGMPERESPKRTISVTGELGLLQMVSKPDTRRCVRKEAEPQRGWIRGGVPTRSLSLERGWGLGGLGCYKWYKSQTSSNVPTRRLSPKKGGHKAVCQQGR